MDLGYGHRLEFVGWHPDPKLNPQYAGASVDRWGASIDHPRADDPSRECHGFVTFDGPEQREHGAGRPMWTVESWDPLTLSPSVLCKLCGDHGFVRGGRWVAA